MLTGFAASGFAAEPRWIPRAVKTCSTILAMVWRSGTIAAAAGSSFAAGISGGALGLGSRDTFTGAAVGAAGTDALLPARR